MDALIRAPVRFQAIRTDFGRPNSSTGSGLRSNRRFRRLPTTRARAEGITDHPLVVCCPVENDANLMIADIGNPARHVCLAQFILPWREREPDAVA